MDANDKKLGELMLYIAGRSECDPQFGATKLNKILFYSDFIMYSKRRVPITGQEYMRLEKGPAPRRLVPVRDELTNEGWAVIKKTKYHGYNQNRLIALREPDLSLFTAEEIAEVDRVISELADYTGTQTSTLSHLFVGWKAAGDKETIPYSTVFLSNREPTADENQRGLKIAQRLATLQ